MIVGLAFCISALLTVGTTVAASRRPNIILILTDDQDRELGSMQFMPKLQRLLVQEGAEFSNAYVTTPVCCPSRSSILTGQYVHNHNVYTNHDNCSSYEWRQKYEHLIFGSELQNAGYRTAYVGKYLNEYNGTYVPLGWNDWVGLLYNSKYYNYTLNVNGRLQYHGNDYYRDYLPDLIANESVRIMQQHKLYFKHQPLLMVLSFPSPHGREDAAPQYQTRFDGREFFTHHTPAWNAAPNPDKEWLLRNAKPMTPLRKKFTDILQRKRLQTLLSVDDAIELLTTNLQRLKMLADSYIIFTSDHGYHLGQFGIIKGKSLPYEFDTKVPFVVRGPGVGRGTRVSNIVLNVDIAPTILDLAQIMVPYHMDGRSIVKLLDLSSQHQLRGGGRNGTVEVRRARAWRESFLIERGKLTSRIMRLREQLEATKNGIVSKRARLEGECKEKELRFPCEPGQKWFCWRRRDGTGLRKLKCRVSQLSMKLDLDQSCRCPRTENTNLLPNSPRDRISLRGRVFDVWNDPVLRNVSEANFSRQCYFVTQRQKLVCLPYMSQQAWARDARTVERVIEVLKKYFNNYSDLRRVLKRARPTSQRLPGLCRCPKTESPLIELRRLRAERRHRRRQRKKKKKKKRKNKIKFCNEKNMNCFVHTRDHWRTPPYWRYVPICFCGNSNNNTYWCVRTINSTDNTLYCEYVTGFITFFDLNADPYQLVNRAKDLAYGIRQQMHATLNRLRRCKGPRQCTVRSNSGQRLRVRHRRRLRRMRVFRRNQRLRRRRRH